MMAVEIKQTLEREFEVFLTAQDIRGLNFAKLQEMSAKEKEQEKKRGGPKIESELLSGMKLLVRLVGNDNLKPEVCLKLNTQNDETRTEVFLIPGIEGFGSVFANLAPKLKSPATCLQLELEDKSLTITDMAKRLLPV